MQKDARLSASPSIGSGDEPAPRPVVSVVIPTFEPDRLLLETIGSVLAQDLGPERMQIAVVDDRSERADVRALLATFEAGDRIEYHAHGERLGLAGNWNRAIDYARGEFVHILHQDDTVRPGFYRALLSGLQNNPRVGMAFCRHAFINERNDVQRISHRERWRAGVLSRWLDRISERQRLQCPAAIVRRDVYRTLGGFRDDLPYALDWEMWVRIASAYDVWYEPRVLASYRRHRGAETARLEAKGETVADMMTAVSAIAAHLPAARRDTLANRAYRRLARVHARRAAKLLETGSTEIAAQYLNGARSALAKLPDSLSARWAYRRIRRLELRLAHRQQRTQPASHEQT